MLTRESAIKSATQFIKVLQQNGYNPQQAYLFGSTINGNIHEYSDIDLALWDEKFDGAPHLDIPKVVKLMRKFNEIELHPYNTADTEETNPFIEVIKKTGIQIPINNRNEVNEPDEDYNKEK
jgi:predicted nucleotidyltransferase